VFSTAEGTKGRATSGATQDAAGVLSIQLGRLLIATKQHVRSLLNSFIYSDPGNKKKRKIVYARGGFVKMTCAYICLTKDTFL
jgi:hypothetical protein